MKHTSCDMPLALPVLLEYWFGDLTPDHEQPIEEHLLGCEHCSSRLQEIVSLGSGIASSFRHGEINTVISLPNRSSLS